MDGQTQESMRGSNCIVVSCYIKRSSGAMMWVSSSSTIALSLFTSQFFHKVLAGNVLLLSGQSGLNVHVCLYELLMHHTCCPSFDWRIQYHQKALSNCTKLSRYIALNWGHSITYWSYSSGWAMTFIQLSHVFQWLSDGHFIYCYNQQPWAFPVSKALPFQYLLRYRRPCCHCHLSVLSEKKNCSLKTRIVQ